MSLPFTTINSFCRDKILPVLVDNIFKSNIIHYRFYRKAQKWRGGNYLEVPIEYAANSNAEAYAGSTALTVDEVEIATKARLPVRQYNVAIAITGVDLETNKGDAQVIDLVKARMKNAKKSIEDLQGTDFFAVQTGQKLDGVGGIYAAAAGTPYAGINPTDFAGWICNGGNAVKAAGGELTLAELNTEWNNCKVDTDKPTLLVMHDAVWSSFEENLVAKNIRYEDKKLANVGFENITFHGSPAVTDSHVAAETMYLFNEKYLRMYVMPGMNFRFIPFQYPTDKDLKIAHIRWYGNLICTNVARQGKITGITSVAST